MPVCFRNWRHSMTLTKFWQGVRFRHNTCLRHRLKKTLSPTVTSVANLATLSLDLATLKKKKRLATFGKTLATFQMSPVLSCEHEILSYTSPCVCSDQSALASAERSSTADIDVNDLRMCTRCCHGPITCLLLLCLK